MRLWLSRSTEIPLREQLVTQIRLGVASGDLKAGQRLPSTRELARRFHIHSNTVSAAYRELHRDGWVDFRKGSGVYVHPRSSPHPSSRQSPPGIGLDQLVANFFRTARHEGHSLGDIQSRLQHWLTMQPPDHFLVIEPDPELRNILVTEIESATGVRALGAETNECGTRESVQESTRERFPGAVPVTMYSQLERIRGAAVGL